MPQVTEELRNEWGIDERKAQNYLEQRGYILTMGSFWLAPSGESPNEKDYRAIDYLIQEWDFGGLQGTYLPIGNRKLR